METLSFHADSHFQEEHAGSPSAPLTDFAPRKVRLDWSFRGQGVSMARPAPGHSSQTRLLTRLHE